MEKIILVHYIHIGNMNVNDVSRYMKEFSETCKPKEEDIISYWIPVKNGDSRVECINPKLISDDDFNEIKKVLDRNQQIVDDFTKINK